MIKDSKKILERLKEQREKLNARIQSTEARVKNSERKKDTRKKILVGSYFLDKAKKEGNLDSIKKALDKFLTRNNDRALFDLKPLPENSKRK